MDLPKADSKVDRVNGYGPWCQCRSQRLPGRAPYALLVMTGLAGAWKSNVP